MDQRDAILDAAVDVVAAAGLRQASVAKVLSRARISRRMFLELFDDLDDCLIAVMDGTLEHVSGLVTRAFAERGGALDGMCVALADVLSLFDQDLPLARLCLVETLAGSPALVENRQRVVNAFRSVVVAAVADEAPDQPTLVADGSLAAVMGLAYRRLIDAEQDPLVELTGPLMGLIATYLGKSSTDEWIARGQDAVHARRNGGASPLVVPFRQASALPGTVRHPRARLMRACLLHLAGKPDQSNREVGTQLGISHQSQVSRLLARLHEQGLVSRCSEGIGRRNLWHLTPLGERTAQILEAHEANQLAGRPAWREFSPGRSLAAAPSYDVNSRIAG